MRVSLRRMQAFEATISQYGLTKAVALKRLMTAVAAGLSAAPARSSPTLPGAGVEASERLDWHRWIVERTLSWLNQFPPPHEQRADIHKAFVILSYALICLNQIRRFC